MTKLECCAKVDIDQAIAERDRLAEINKVLVEAFQKQIRPISAAQSKGALIAHYTAIAHEALAKAKEMGK